MHPAHKTHPAETDVPEPTALYDTNKYLYSDLAQKLEQLEFSFPVPVPESEEARTHPLLRQSSQASTQNGKPDDSDKLTVEIKPAKRPSETEISDIIEQAKIKWRKNRESSRSSTLDFENTNRLPMNDNSIVEQPDEASTRPTFRRAHSSSLSGTGEARKPILPRRISELRGLSSGREAPVLTQQKFPLSRTQSDPLLSTLTRRDHNYNTLIAWPSTLARCQTMQETPDKLEFAAINPSFLEAAPEADHRDRQDIQNAISASASECPHDDSGLSNAECDTLRDPIRVYNRDGGSMLHRSRRSYRLNERAAECTGAPRPDPLSAVFELTDDDELPSHGNEAISYEPHALTGWEQQILQGESVDSSSESNRGSVFSSSSQRQRDTATPDSMRSTVRSEAESTKESFGRKLYERLRPSQLSLLTLTNKKSATSFTPNDVDVKIVEDNGIRARFKRSTSRTLGKLKRSGSVEL